MTDDRPSSESPSRPTLDPTSLGCILPGALAVLVFGLAWMGIQSLKKSSGIMSIQAAEFGLQSSGLPADAKAPFEAQVDRIRRAHESENLDAQGAVEGVKGLLATRTIELLVVDDVRARRLPASGLSAEERAAGDAALERLATSLDAETLRVDSLIEVLGPLTEVPEDGSVVPLDDAGLRALLERADAALAEIDDPESPPRPVDAAALLSRFEQHVDTTLASRSGARD
ncbi:MAG: hypothetical protein AAF726_07210 [Planctomycetota bacterium]